jgi:hypothetical protein
MIDVDVTRERQLFVGNFVCLEVQLWLKGIVNRLCRVQISTRYPHAIGPDLAIHRGCLMKDATDRFGVIGCDFCS